MKKDNKKDDTFEMIEILENATIIYEDENRAIFEAIFLTDKGEIIFGRILAVEKTDLCKSVSSIDCHDIFRECGGIPKDNIKSIEGGTKKTVLKKISFFSC
jgi:hypothetical protein